MDNETPNLVSDSTATGDERSQAKREIIEFAKMVVLFLAFFMALRWCVIEGYEVQGPSMYPTLDNNDRILVLKLPLALSQLPGLSALHALKPGDIVVFNSPDENKKRYVKRIIAEGPRTNPGTVSAQGPDAGVSVRVEEGRIYVNNNAVDEKYLPGAAEEMRGDAPAAATLGPHQYFVMGDNRGVSRDSRSFGPINEDGVVGRAVLRFWPLSKFGLL